MSEKASGSIEKGARWYRNFNLVGAGALAGAGVLLAPVSPELATVSYGLAAINVAQAGLAEVVRRWKGNRPKPSPAAA